MFITYLTFCLFCWLLGVLASWLRGSLASSVSGSVVCRFLYLPEVVVQVQVQVQVVVVVVVIVIVIVVVVVAVVVAVVVVVEEDAQGSVMQMICLQVGVLRPTQPPPLLRPSMLAIVHLLHHVMTLHDVSSCFIISEHRSAISTSVYHFHPFSPVAIVLSFSSGFMNNCPNRHAVDHNYLNIPHQNHHLHHFPS